MASGTAAGEYLFVVLAVSAGIGALAGLIFAGGLIVHFIRHAEPIDETATGPGENIL